MKGESASRRFKSGEGPSRGLLRDCTTSPINRFAALKIKLVVLNTVYRISTLYMMRGSVDCGSLSYLISNLRTKEEYIEMAFTILRIFISN